MGGGEEDSHIGTGGAAKCWAVQLPGLHYNCRIRPYMSKSFAFRSVCSRSYF